MRPHNEDYAHNLDVGRAFRDLVNSLIAEGRPPASVDFEVGRHVNTLLQKGYDLGVSEVTPSTN
jgi:hypothetical protein